MTQQSHILEYSKARTFCRARWLGLVYGLAATALLCVSTANAQQPEVTIEVCTKEQAILTEVGAHALELETALEGIQATLEGRTREDFDPSDLLAKLEADNDGYEGARSTWPEDLLCGNLRSAYRDVRDRVDSANVKLEEYRQSFWLALPPVARRELRRVVASDAWLQTHIQPSSAPESISSALKQLRALRWTYATLLPSLRSSVTPAEANLWLLRWHDALDLTEKLDEVAESALEEAADSESDELRAGFDHIRLHAHTIALAFNRVRAHLWSNHREATSLAVREQNANELLLLDEARAGINALDWLYLDTKLGNNSTQGEYRPILLQLAVGVEYLLGFGALFLLAFVARRTESIAAAWQESFAVSSRGIRSRAQLVRLAGGMPQWLPWITGWYGLAILDSYFQSAQLVLLLPILIIAQLYVVYGLLVLAGEWFLKRMTELAGAYLNEQQQAEVTTNAKQAALIVLLPWLLQALVRLTIHASLSLSLLEVVTWAALLLAFSALLRPWHEEFVSAVQYFLPSKLGGVGERLFRGLRFYLFAPLAAPLLVTATLASFLNKSLIQFDWYRRLVARSFLLRSALPEDREALPHDETAFQEYAAWFQQDSELDVPCLPAQINEKLQEYLEPWLDQQSDENTLLLTGEKGSGKTTAIHRLESWLGEREGKVELVLLSVPPRITTPAELHALFEPALGVSFSNGPAELVRSDEDRTKTVIVLDSAQNLFLRTVGGLAAWEELLSITRARLRNVFWLVSIDNQGWAYLANVFGGQGQFNKVLRCRPWTQNEIRSLILSRNQQSGVRITYDEVLLSTRGPEAGSLRNAEQLYFSLLWDTCRGNPGLALRLWLTSVHVWSETVTVGLPEDVSSGILERLDEEQFFVFAALVIHHNLLFEELLESTAVSDSTVRSAIRVGLDQGIIERGTDRRYRVTPLWYYPLTRILARKNLLHE